MQLPPARLDRLVEGDEPGLLRRVGEQVGLAAADGLLLHVGEEGLERVEVARRVRVELVVVALRAAHRRAHPHARDVANAVGEVDGAVLLRLRAALLGRLQEAVVARGDPLLEAGVGQEVPRELLGGEAVERQIAVEGRHDPVAVAPHRPGVVAVVADAVRVAHEVEPERGHPLAVARRGEEAVDLALVGVGPRVRGEGAHVLRRRRKAGEVEAHAAQQLGPRRLRRGREALGLEPREEEGVDGVARPGAVLHRGDGRPRERHVRPVRLPGRALGDPAADDVHLRRGEARLAALRVRHAPRLVGVGDTREEGAPLRRARDDRHGAGAQRRLRRILDVEAQRGLAAVAVGAVADEAALGQDRPDVAVEAHARRPEGRPRGGREARRLGHRSAVRPGRTRLDPPPKRVDLGHGQRIGLLRHPVDGIRLDQVRVEGAVERPPGRDHGAVLTAGDEALPRVEAQLPLLLRRAMAADARDGEDRPHVPREVGRRGGGARGLLGRAGQRRAGERERGRNRQRDGETPTGRHVTPGGRV